MPRTRPLLALAALLLAARASAESHLLNRIAVFRPATWDSPIVPRVSSGSLLADNLVTAPLLSPTSPVSLNWAVSTNQAVSGPWLDELSVDGVPLRPGPRYLQQPLRVVPKAAPITT